jgi:hypothetical protein
MTADEEKPAAAVSAPPKMQFSLGTLLLLPVVVGCALAVLFTKPPNVAAVELFVIGFLLPVVLTGGIVYGKGYMRAFCIGAVFPAGALFYVWVVEISTVLMTASWEFDSNSVFTLQRLFGSAFVAAVVSGSVCVVIYCLSLPAVAAGGSARRRGWGRMIVILLLILLVLSGPVVGRIGIALDWWKAESPSLPAIVTPPVTYQGPYASPAPSSTQSPQRPIRLAAPPPILPIRARFANLFLK